MNNNLLSILCQEDYWYWDTNHTNTITFHENGTGEVRSNPNIPLKNI